jgi:hypothetical protein
MGVWEMKGTRLGMHAAVSAALAIGLATCGGGGSSPTNPSPPSGGGGGGGGNPVQTTTITIGANGAVTPNNIQVAVGSRVMMVNSDTRTHDMASDPHPDHTNCTELNSWGFLQPGQSRESGNLTTAKTCSYHDHNSPTNTALMGRIVIQ